MKKIKFNFAKKKIQINLSNKLFYTLVVVGILILSSVVVYAIVPNPGHAVSEVDWSGTISQLNTNSLCLTGDCKSAWPSGGGGTDTDCILLSRYASIPPGYEYTLRKYLGTQQGGSVNNDCVCTVLTCPSDQFHPIWFDTAFCYGVPQSYVDCSGCPAGQKSQLYTLGYNEILYCK